MHVIGKGIIRFHAVYWPAILLSAGEPLPTAIFVHDYLTVDGQKLSKSFGAPARPRRDRRVASEPTRCAGGFCATCRVPATPTSARSGSRARANELADGLGNLINRTIALVARDRPNGVAQSSLGTGHSSTLHSGRPSHSARHRRRLLPLRRQRCGRGVLVARRGGQPARRGHRPWERAEGETEGDAGSYRDEALRVLVDACHTLARESKPFLPAASDRIERALVACDPNLGRQLFPKAV